jgi:O-antigen/teichoic acid export membrane protein
MLNAAKNFILLSSSEFISKALGFITTILIARRIGVEGFGELGLVLAVYTYFTFLANPGYDTIGAREIVKNKMDARVINNSIFILKLWSSIIVFLVLLLFCYFIPFSASVKQLLMLQGLSLLAIPFSFQFFLRGGNQMNIIAISRLIQSSAYLVAVYFGVKDISYIMNVPIAFFISTLVGLIPMSGLIRNYCSLSLYMTKDKLKQLFIASLTVGAASLCIQIYLNVDTVMLGLFRTNREVGLYTSAYKIVTLATIIPTLIFTSFLPFLVTSEKVNLKQWKMYALIMFSIGLLISISVGILAPLFITILYGAEFNDAVLPLRILSVNIFAVFISITFAQPLLLIGKEKQYLLIVAWSAGLNIFLNLFAVPLYGMLGAAITTVLAEGLVAIRSWIAMDNEIIFTYKKDIAEIIIIAISAAVLMLLFEVIFNWNIIYDGISFIVIYCMLILTWFTIRKSKRPDLV